MLKFSTMNPQQRKDYENYYRDVLLTGASGFKVLEPSPIFDQYGLRFPTDYLQTIGVQVILLPLEIMANYADAITVDAVNNNDMNFIIQSGREVMATSAEELIERGNATSIGNIAYVVLFSKDIMFAKAMEDFLERAFQVMVNVLKDTIKNLPTA